MQIYETGRANHSRHCLSGRLSESLQIGLNHKVVEGLRRHVNRQAMGELVHRIDLVWIVSIPASGLPGEQSAKD